MNPGSTGESRLWARTQFAFEMGVEEGVVALLHRGHLGLERLDPSVLHQVHLSKRIDLLLEFRSRSELLQGWGLGHSATWACGADRAKDAVRI